MYEVLNKYLNGFFTEDYWYDEGFGIAREMLEKFDENDWEKLLDSILSKSIEWQIRFAYCVDRGINDKVVLESLILLSSIDNNELFETCVDALRGFVDSENIKMVLGDNILRQRVEILLPKCGVATRKVFEDFIRKIQN